MARSRLLTLILAAALVGPGPMGPVQPAAAQQPDRLSQATASLPAPAARALEETVADARRRGLPTDPLVDKALEGAAKSVPPDVIVSVVRRLAGQLDHAQGLLGSDGAPPAPTDVAAVADALRRGVPDEAVRAVRREIPRDRPVAMAVHVLADLLDRGVPVASALDVLQAWHRRGANPDDLRELPAAVERLVRRGALPEQAAAAVTSAVRAGRRPAAAGPPDHAGPPSRVRRGPSNGPPIPPGAGPPARPGNPGKNQGKGKGKGKGNGPPPTSA